MSKLKDDVRINWDGSVLYVRAADGLLTSKEKVKEIHKILGYTEVQFAQFDLYTQGDDIHKVISGFRSDIIKNNLTHASIRYRDKDNFNQKIMRDGAFIVRSNRYSLVLKDGNLSVSFKKMPFAYEAEMKEVVLVASKKDVKNVRISLPMHKKTSDYKKLQSSFLTFLQDKYHIQDISFIVRGKNDTIVPMGHYQRQKNFALTEILPPKNNQVENMRQANKTPYTGIKPVSRYQMRLSRREGRQKGE